MNQPPVSNHWLVETPPPQPCGRSNDDAGPPHPTLIGSIAVASGGPMSGKGHTDTCQNVEIGPLEHRLDYERALSFSKCILYVITPPDLAGGVEKYMDLKPVIAELGIYWSRARTLWAEELAVASTEVPA